MKTRYLRFERLKSLPGMHHIKVCKEVELENGDDEDAAMASLQESVDRELGDFSDVATIRGQLDQLRWERDHYTTQVTAKKGELERLRSLIASIEDLSVKMEKAGIELPEGLLSEVPF